MEREIPDHSIFGFDIYSLCELKAVVVEFEATACCGVIREMGFGG